MKFRKKPVTIEAIQWTGENLKEVIQFTGKHPRFNEWFSCWEDYERHVQHDGRRFKIFTLEGAMTADPGDWIIRGVKGEHYPCKPDIFAATYDAAAEIRSDLPPHQQRVVMEKAELDERRVKLGAFKNTNLFASLPWQEQERLNTQSHIMTMYSAVLGERIAAFGSA